MNDNERQIKKVEAQIESLNRKAPAWSSSKIKASRAALGAVGSGRTVEGLMRVRDLLITACKENDIIVLAQEECHPADPDCEEPVNPDPVEPDE